MTPAFSAFLMLRRHCWLKSRWISSNARITALVSRVWDSRSVLLACAGLIAAAAVLNLCVPEVYRINRLTDPAT
ncbi:hypothetical protein [Streptomyces sp. CoH27]|uniref:hypothetical protein n=1 Tax=Streptomyces sp. CoH27 TaxID=2875763 RepID=UPI0027DFFF14|nr:hypothetical protein [Streptomyces sp. CoH27]